MTSTNREPVRINAGRSRRHSRCLLVSHVPHLGKRRGPDFVLLKKQRIIFNMRAARDTPSIQPQILGRLAKKARGRAFTPFDFAEPWDLQAMIPMFFTPPPPIATIPKTLADLEARIRNLPSSL